MKKVISLILSLCMVLTVLNSFTLNVSATNESTLIDWGLGDCYPKVGQTTSFNIINGVENMYIIDDNALLSFGEIINNYYVEVKGVASGETVVRIYSNGVQIAQSEITVGVCEFDFTYEVNDNCATITGYTGCLTDVVEIPSEVDGYPVTSIGDSAFYHCYSLREVVVPSSVEIIEDYAFGYCWNLSKITLPEGLISIGEGSFIECDLTEIDIPNNVSSIGYQAFYSCHNLTSVTIPDSVIDIGKAAFYCCYALESAVIGNGLISIENNLFSGCDNLTNIVIGNNVKNIGSAAFIGCNNLETVYFIGTEEEWNQIKISNTNEPLLNANIIFVCDHTFSNNICSKCGTTLNVSANGKFESVDTTATGNITVPLSSNGVLVSSIGAGAFKDCASLSSVMLYDNITEIADDAFDGVSDNFVIKCYEDSPASVWAEEHGINYEIVPIPYGNVNADESTDIFDLISLAKHIVGSGVVIDTRAANTNAPNKADRSVDIFDLISLAKYICNPETVLGPQA